MNTPNNNPAPQTTGGMPNTARLLPVIPRVAKMIWIALGLLGLLVAIAVPCSYSLLYSSESFVSTNKMVVVIVASLTALALAALCAWLLAQMHKADVQELAKENEHRRKIEWSVFVHSQQQEEKSRKELLDHVHRIVDQLDKKDIPNNHCCKKELEQLKQDFSQFKAAKDKEFLLKIETVTKDKSTEETSNTDQP